MATLESIDQKIDDFRHYSEKQFERLNGTVYENSKDITKLKIWRGYTKGFAYCFTAVLIPVVFFLIRLHFTL